MSSFKLPATLVAYFEAEGYDNYRKVRQLTDEESPKDPKNDPFRSTYKARNLLQEILQKVHKEREDLSSDVSLKIMEAAIQHQLGLNYIHAEERPAGEECLNKCVEILTDDVAFRKEGISVALSVHTELGILWASRYQGKDKALSNLQTVENMYRKYKRDVGEPPLSIKELLSPVEFELTDLQREVKYEKIYTHALFYLAQAHKNLENYEISAEYCKRTLRRQIKAKDYEPKEWAINAAGLSQYFITKNMFREAKHCLSCANVVIEEARLPEGLGEPSADEDEDIKSIRNAIPQKKADIARCWVKYFLALLEYSKEQLYDDICELDSARQVEAIQRLQLDDDEPKEQYRMPLEVGAIEDTVRHIPVNTFEECRELFLLGKRYAERALEYFVMDGYVTDNIELTQDLSALYKHIIFFEVEKDRKCKMHKRRADMLSSVLKELNPQFYLLICRQLQFELGEIYSNMLDLKIAIANESNESPSTHAVKKINSLCRSSILYFKRFLDTLKIASSKEFPATFEDDVERPAIVAHFYLARIHSKIVAPVRTEKLNFMTQSLECYKWIVDYVTRNPKCEPNVQKEIDICREMVALLPKSMERLMN